MNTNITTQVCKKCNEEKPETEFYRRGTSRHRICKVCYRGYSTPKSTRIINVNDASIYPAVLERIEKLEPKLRVKARSYASYQLEADDIYSAMVAKIMTKSKPEDSDARILTRATWAAKEVVRRQNRYSMIVDNEDSASSDDEDGFAEFTASPTQSAEDDFVQREQTAEIKKVIETLPEEYQVIISKLMLGYKQREIATELRKSNQAVSSAIKSIGAMLVERGLSQAFSFA